MKQMVWQSLFILVWLVSNSIYANTGYQIPSEPLTKLVDAKVIPTSMLSSNNRWLALLQREQVVTLTDLDKASKSLAGIKFSPDNFTRSSRKVYSSIEFKHVESGTVIKPNSLPQGKLRAAMWSPNSRYFSFVLEQERSANLWLYDIEKRKIKQITQTTLNGVVTKIPYRWLPDSSGFVVNFAINHQQPFMIEKATHITPTIQQSNGVKSPVRTYQNLLSDAYDEKQFKYYAQGQLVKIPLNSPSKLIGQPALIRGFSVSPDSTTLLVATLSEPFSYQVPFSMFATHWQIWGMTGFPLYDLAKQTIADSLPQGFDSVRTGPREFQWRADQGATVIWAEAQDDGDMSKDVPFHDHLFSLSAPYKKEPKLFLRVKNRFSSIQWANANVAILNEWKFKTRLIKSTVFSPLQPDVNQSVFSSRSYNDAYKNPGRFVTTMSDLGSKVLKLVGDRYLFLMGEGASEQGNIPFLDRYDVKTNTTTRLWSSTAPYYERVQAVLDDEGTRFITLRESNSEQPNFFIRDLTFGNLTQLTRFEHPYPEFKNVRKQQVKYKRDDGVDLTGNLYLPLDYDPSQGPIPVLMWAYPQEYKNKKIASQLRESPYQFSYIGYWGPIPYLANGIAIFDDPTMPIIGEDKARPNDSFRRQLVSSASAAVKVLIDQGIADPNKIAIAGHSYGAFMVANLLAHSDLFVTGIARSGAYNRSLTPFGFQGEERDFWQAQKVYSDMSPFFHAEKINEPMLLIHGEKDPNSGTYPMQSKRMFAALKGLGKQARLVMLPNEGHGYRAKESILHVLWEQEQWLQKYLLPKVIEEPVLDSTEEDNITNYSILPTTSRE